MGKAIAFLYGIVAHVGFLAVFMYLVGFLANYAVPKSIDSGQEGPFGQALLINVLLLAIFAVPHSIMARPGFKQAWTKIIPSHIERSTYVMISNLLLILLLWQWQPMTGVIWHVGHPVLTQVLWGLFDLGWLVLVLATFMINHFDLFGTRQVYIYLRGKEYSTLPFRTKGFYAYIRHPLMLGWFLGFWSTPHMTVGHLVFAVVTTVYILIAIQIEEKDLVRFHGDAYRDYKRRVSMLLPMPAKK